MRAPRVVLADDHLLILDAFEKLLEPECEVVGKVTDGRALLDIVPDLNPDVVILDISMPNLNGLAAARKLRESLPKVKLIFVTVHEDPDLAAEAFRIGASGFLLKSSAASELFQAIKAVMQGQSYATPRITDGMVKALQDPGRRRPSEILTSRQREVLQLLSEGYSMKQVGGILKITPRTVAFHKYRMMEQLGIETSAELVRFAVKQHIVMA
ncbi:MAG: response regulator transcription factor [Planctomycetota bacterium]|nr:response regulator transcription factor [Planctomycetota bacterium]